MSVCVLGSLNVDIVAQVPRLPRPGETLMSARCEQFPGGKGANQVVAAARVGAHTTLLGTVGPDEAGKWMCEFLHAQGVDVSHIDRRSDAPTGRAFICVDANGENFIVVDSGANRVLDVATALRGLPAHPRVLLTQLETPVDAALACFTAPGSMGTTRILNAAPAIPEGRRLFEHADVIVLNETELATYTEVRPGSTPAAQGGTPRHAQDFADAVIVELARSLLCREDQSIIVTLGARGVITTSKQRWFATAAHDVEVIDTTGAGDCFCGALAAALDDGLAQSEAVEFANAAAALSVGRKGAASSMPTRVEVQRTLAATRARITPSRSQSV